ncbi:gp436 family protein [Bergeriella denitrificans]|uniref:Phage protein n=1 Tax=Bergeriella denitrificans TaxID=494 RepID=A0A378UHW8_BERDE|nr:phage protein Gp36 family protein [Bergeriella denitrificans]STZ76333.1 phage protein [Bergeriella denitrificans]
MAYATVDDMVARFGDLELIQLTDRDRDGRINAEVAAVALEDATAEIDAYLGRFRLPFEKVPPVLVRLCCDIARYRLTSASGVLITEEIRNRYKIDVLDLLKALAKGEVQLGLDDDGSPVESDADGVQFVSGNNRIFGRTRHGHHTH